MVHLAQLETTCFWSHMNNLDPFLDVMVLRKTDLRLGHKVYRKPTHTDRYLHKNSNHQPRQKRDIIKTLVDRANRNCEAQFLNTELDHLNWALQANGYSKNEITRAIKPRKKRQTEEEKQPPKNKVFLPYIKGVMDRMGKLLKVTPSGPVSSFSTITIFRDSQEPGWQSLCVCSGKGWEVEGAETIGAPSSMN